MTRYERENSSALPLPPMFNASELKSHSIQFSPGLGDVIMQVLLPDKTGNDCYLTMHIHFMGNSMERLKQSENVES